MNNSNPQQTFLNYVYEALNISRIWWNWRQDEIEEKEEKVIDNNEGELDLVHYEVPIKNHYDLQYTAKVHIGTPIQTLNVIWDTGSSKFLIETNNCKNRIAKYFDTRKSQSYNKVVPNQEAASQYADGTWLKGFYATERVCVTDSESSCANEFQFVALTE